jgi:hypothetical protein
VNFELFLAMLFAGIVGYGFREQRMPARFFDLDRATNPLGFWAGTAVYSAVAIAFLLAAFGLGAP